MEDIVFKFLLFLPPDHKVGTIHQKHIYRFITAPVLFLDAEQSNQQKQLKIGGVYSGSQFERLVHHSWEGMVARA